jgi:hypothetical protein
MHSYCTREGVIEDKVLDGTWALARMLLKQGVIIHYILYIILYTFHQNMEIFHVKFVHACSRCVRSLSATAHHALTHSVLPTRAALQCACDLVHRQRRALWVPAVCA